MSKIRPMSEIGPTTNGMMLPEPEQVSYPIQIQSIQVGIGDYIAPETPVYTFMDRDGSSQSYNYGSYGQITKITVNALDVFTEPQRIFELCCDEIAQTHARARNPIAAKEPAPDPTQKITQSKDNRGMRWELAGAVLGTTILAGVILNANGVFDGRNAEPLERRAGETLETTKAQSASTSASQLSISRPSGVQPIHVPGSIPGTTRGRQTLENGIYSGDLKESTRHGQGTYTYDNGDTYEGTFLNNARTGRGKYKFASGTIYSGDFLDGRFQGEGQMSYSSGASYRGGFKGGEFDGIGRMQHANGVVYEGSWTEGEYNGTGTLSFTNGAAYSGDFRQGARTGKGKITFVDGDSYEGDFADGVFQGFGRYDFASGGHYLGAYKLGKQHGDGVLTLADGGVFKGAFLDGKPQGQGVFSRRTGDVITGIFRGDIGTGTGRIQFADGDSYSGDFNNGKLKGKTKFQKRVKIRKTVTPKPYASYQEMMDTERDLAEQRYAERRHRRARSAARRAKRSSGKSDDNTLLTKGNLPSTMYYAVLHQDGGNVPAIGKPIQCANTVETDVACSVARKQKVWTVSLACDPHNNFDQGEALDRARLTVFMAKGNTDRMKSHFILWNKSQYQGAGPDYGRLERKIWDELSSVQMKTKQGTQIPVYYDSYEKMRQFLQNTGCRTIEVNAGKGASKL